MIKCTSTRSPAEKRDMNFSMRLSFFVGLFILAIKIYAYQLTGSAAILSDASESVIHTLAVGFAAYSMWLSLKPADLNHPYGHDKIGFFSAGFEGAMIIMAAIYIIYESIHKMINGYELTNLDAGMGFTVVVIAINFALGFFLIRKGKRYKSIVLEANGKHIITDCWTSFSVIAALVLVKWTGIVLFDPIIAILAALNIVWTGGKLVKRSVSGLMDQADRAAHKLIVEILTRETSNRGLEFHQLRHRQSGYKIFVEFHLLFPQEVSLGAAHETASEIESSLRHALDVESDIFTHLEPKEGHDSTHMKFGLPI